MTRIVLKIGSMIAAAGLALTAHCRFGIRTAEGRGPAGGCGRSADRPLVPDPVPADRDQPLPGPGADQREGTVQLPGRLGRPGALRRDRDGQEDRAEARSGRILDAHRSARSGGGRTARGRQGSGRRSVPARGDECAGSARRLDRRNSGIHHSGAISLGDRSDAGSHDVDPARPRAARPAGAEACTPARIPLSRWASGR